jgi:hypothetical protein
MEIIPDGAKCTLGNLHFCHDVLCGRRGKLQKFVLKRDFMEPIHEFRYCVTFKQGSSYSAKPKRPSCFSLSLHVIQSEKLSKPQ